MKFAWHRDNNVICFGKVFNDGWGAIVLLGGMSKPWIWKVKVNS